MRRVGKTLFVLFMIGLTASFFTACKEENEEVKVDYTVEYWFQTAKNSAEYKINAKETVKGSAAIDTVPSIKIKSFNGYALNKGKSGDVTKFKLSSEAQKNVIKLYFDVADVTYKIEYRQQNVDNLEQYDLIDSFEGTGSFGEKIFIDFKAFDGFELSNQADFTDYELTAGDNIITLKYNRLQFEYLISIYKEDGSGQYVLDEVATQPQKALFGQTVSVVPPVYEGFVFNNTESDDTTHFVITSQVEKNSYNLYYDIANSPYTVHYLLQNATDLSQYDASDKKTTGVGANGKKANFTPFEFVGFKRTAESDAAIQNFVLGPNTNELNLKYDRVEVQYSIEYHQQKADLSGYEPITEFNTDNVATAKFGTKPTIKEKTLDGFTKNAEKSTQMDTFELGMNAQDNVISILLDRNEVPYTVNYLFEKTQGQKDYEVNSDIQADINATGIYGTVISFPIAFAKYTLNKEASTPNYESYSLQLENNEITLKFDQSDVSCLVEYWLEDLEQGKFSVNQSHTTVLSGSLNQVIQVTPDTITGFTFNAEKSTPNLDAVTLTGHITVQLYYNRKTVEYQTVTHKESLDGGYETITNEKVQGKFGEVPTVNTEIEGFTLNLSKSDTPAAFILNEGENLLNLYFDRQNYNYTVEHHFEEANNDQSAWAIDSNYTQELSAKFGSTPQLTAVSLDGFTLNSDKTAQPSEFVLYQQNKTFIFYYNRNVVDYTVEYHLEKATELGQFEKQIEVEKGSAKFGTTPVIVEKSFDGFEKNENRSTKMDTFILKTDVAQNVIKIFMNRKDVGYTVEYYLQNTDLNGYYKDDLKKQTGSAKYGTVAPISPSNIEGFTVQQTSEQLVQFVIGLDAAQNVYRLDYNRDEVEYSIKYYFQTNPEPAEYQEDTNMAVNNLKAYFGQTPLVERVETYGFDFNNNLSTNLQNFFLKTKDNVIEFYHDFHYFTGRSELDVISKKKAFPPVPSGYKDTGYEIYLDMDMNTQERIKRPNHDESIEEVPSNPPVQLLNSWDLVVTFHNHFVDMGFMGTTKGVPKLDIKVNDAENVSFYLSYDGTAGTDNELSKRAITVDNSKFVGKGHNGYGHRPRWDNEKLEGDTKMPFPYLSSDFWEMKDMKGGEYVVYSPSRYFVFRTTKNQFFEFTVTQIDALYKKGGNELGLAINYSYRIIHQF